MSDPGDDASPSASVIGVVSALPLELAPFLARCERRRSESGNDFKFIGCRWRGQRVCVVQGGVGSRRARAATHALIDAFAPVWVVTAGLSGALREDLRIGDLIFGDRMLNAPSRAVLRVDLRMNPDFEQRIFTGGLCQSDQIVRTTAEKQELGNATGCVAVDMESFAVAEACQQRGVRCLALRAISDTLKEDLPVEALALLGPKGTIRAGALAGALWKRPGCVTDLWRLREQSVLAAERLAHCLGDVIVQLSASSASTPTGSTSPQ